MTRYYKATRPDGRDFHTGTIDYAAALKSGDPVTHPRPGAGQDAANHLSVSVSPTDCTGMEWPCRLFVVEPVDPWAPEPSRLPSKRACHSLRVVEELPAHEALGPQGEHVAALVDRARSLTLAEVERLAAVWDAAQVAARYAAQVAARYAARVAAWYAAWDAALVAAGYAARDAALALTARDLISAEHYDNFTRPWRTTIGPIHPDDPHHQETP